MSFCFGLHSCAEALVGGKRRSLRTAVLGGALLLALGAVGSASAVTTTYASDGFEDGAFADISGQPGAGYGWNDASWTTSDLSSLVVDSGGPIGAYHVVVFKSGEFMYRTIDLGCFASAKVRFSYKTAGLTDNYGYVTLSAAGVAPYIFSFQGLVQPTNYDEYWFSVPPRFLGKVVTLTFGQAGPQNNGGVFWDDISVESDDVLALPGPHQTVSTYGHLQVSNATLKDQNGDPVQLRGMSTHGVTWFPLSDLNLNDTNNINLLNQEITFDPTQGSPFPYPSSAIGNLVEQWNVQVIKIAMFAYDPWNGVDAKCYTNDYPNWKWYNINLVNSVVQAAIDADVYVIVNWHAGEGNDPDPNVYWNAGQVQEFFTYMVDKWGSYPNIIYETVNSPNNIAWPSSGGTPGLKEYDQNVINHIRAREALNGYANNVIIAGTPTWCQDVDVAASDPLTGNLIAYGFMWYAGTHGAGIRAKGDAALSTLAANSPNQTLFIIEGGTTQSNGTGGVYVSEFNTWMEWAKTNNLSWINWSISNKEEDSAIFYPAILNDVPGNEVAWRGGDGGSISEALASTGFPMRTGPWSATDYTASGKLVRGWIIENTSQNP